MINTYFVLLKSLIYGFFLNGAYEYMYIQRLCRWLQLQIRINYQLGLFRRQIKGAVIECLAKKKG
jgi:hypothetical protein